MGDGEAEFRDFVAARRAALLHTAYLLTGDWGAGEDLLQTALTKTYLAWHRIRERGAVEAYVRRTMARTATSWWRRRWHGERPTADPPDRCAVGDHAQRTADRDLVWQELRALPPGQRAVLVLRFHADLTEAQTAQALGVSVGTVKSQTSRALHRLRERMAVVQREDDAVNQDTVRQHDIHQDSIGQHDIHQDDVRQNDVRQNDVRRDSVRLNGVRRNDVHQDSVDEHDIHQDDVHENNVRRDSVRQDGNHRNDIHQDSVRRNDVRQNDVRRDSVRLNSVRRSGVHRDSSENVVGGTR